MTFNLAHKHYIYMWYNAITCLYVFRFLPLFLLLGLSPPLSLSLALSITFVLLSVVSYALPSLFLTIHKLKNDVSWISRHFDKQWNVSFSRHFLCDHIINKFTVFPLDFYPFLSSERWTWCKHSTLKMLKSFQNSSFALFGIKS